MKPETYQVEMMKQILRVMIIELMDCGGTNPVATCDLVVEDHPKLCAAVGADRTLALCREIFESSDQLESARLQEVFVKFNAQYFSRQLDGFTVLALYYARGESDMPHSGWILPLPGRVDFLNRQIHIALTECRDAMSETLLHFMGTPRQLRVTTLRRNGLPKCGGCVYSVLPLRSKVPSRWTRDMRDRTRVKGQNGYIER